jgi:glycosyltransferase involved in cell wall biosynthesis
VIASVLICTRNRAVSLRETLKAMAQVQIPSGGSCELIVIDNGSTDATAQVAREWHPRNFATRIMGEPTQGQTYARNAGIREAQGEIVVFTDDDVIPQPDWLVNLLEPYGDPAVSGVQGRAHLQFDAPPPPWLELVHRGFLAQVDHGDRRIFPFLKSLTGVNMSFRRKIVAHIGEYNTLLGPGRSGFWDDTEFSVRMTRAGYLLCYQPTALVHHQISTARLTPASFRKAAFQNGVSGYIAGATGAIDGREHPFRDFSLQSLRQARSELKCMLQRNRPLCSQDELFYRMALGEMWARLQGVERLKQRYGSGMEQE